MKSLQLSLIFVLFLKLSGAANILYVMPFTAKSHYIGLRDLALELAKRGHYVYSITPYKEDFHPPTYHQIPVDNISLWSKLFDEPPNIFSMINYSFPTFQMLLYRSGFMVNDLVFNSTHVQKFLGEDHKIDLVISELFFNEGLYMFAHKYQAPLVLVTTFGNSLKANFFGQNPLQMATAYHEYGASPDPFSFIGRLRNFYFSSYDLLMLKFWYFPRQQEYAMQYFKDLPRPVPSLEDLAANAALVLMNSHFSVDTPIAYLPNFIECGGMHVKGTNKSLPEDLQKILDKAKNGVVFLSFGSNVRASDLSEDKQKAFLKVFGELKQTVLMKWEDTTLPDIPKNVVLRNWFPQKEVLAHPNVKLFIGHGGLLGLQETISAGVPILGMPVYGDQYLNMFDVAKRGHGELLEHKDFSEEKLRIVINKILNNDSYIKKAKEVAARFKDRPMSGLDTAVWWTEYVIRHKGADFMKTPTHKLNFLSQHMWDVYLFVIASLFGISYVIYRIFFTLIQLTKKTNKLKQN